ncbi:hypothetical protein [Puniceibacterium sediminis]|uniref:Uncharacterized protein n=1 Tax=Puniceibacterium sediminis TaxID=1608407 RepID=A0A238X8K6_9RHOB|nr:hypothetical protein [Puniceibacterium sediminis]SNR54873.1 hypothetical protein SAMN06265370_109151 [Puniceibacterium sediminis]
MDDTLEQIKAAVPHIIEQEVDNALRKSIEKYFNFYKKGGDVDFIPPRSEPEDIVEGEHNQAIIAEIQQHADENTRLIEMIESVRAQQAELKQLTNHAAVDDE